MRAKTRVISVSRRYGILPEEEEAYQDGKDGNRVSKQFDKSQYRNKTGHTVGGDNLYDSEIPFRMRNLMSYT